MSNAKCGAFGLVAIDTEKRLSRAIPPLLLKAQKNHDKAVSKATAAVPLEARRESFLPTTRREGAEMSVLTEPLRNAVDGKKDRVIKTLPRLRGHF